MNYLNVIFSAVSSAASVPVYAMAAPQGLMADFIVITLDGIAVTETKDLYKSERVNSTLFFHFYNADQAQSELSTVRQALQTGNDYSQAWLENMQTFYNDNDETIIVSADFTFLINY